MPQITQDNRLISVTTALGKDKLLLTSFDGDETISEIFHFQLEFISEDDAVSAYDIVGKTLTVTVNTDSKRYFHGFVKDFTRGEVSTDGLRCYYATVVPWLWFLEKASDCRIFQDKTVVDIVKAVFSEHGFSDFNTGKLGGGYMKRDYCVQYNETDLAFVERLLAEEGIAYSFKHDKSKHELILFDKTSSCENCAEASVFFTQGPAPESHLDSWNRTHEYRTGKFTHRDYNYDTPPKTLEASAATNINLPKAKSYEQYSYPGFYGVDGDAKRLTKLRLEAEESQHDVISASGNCASFSAGGKFRLDKHETKSEKGGYLIVSIKHLAADTTYFSGQNNEGASYSNTFTCVPDKINVRPISNQLKTVMRGPQTAIVVGPSGQEVYLDDKGRIKVQFPWDRKGKKDEGSSCWVRVAQTWAGNKWGSFFIPRIGHEVVVDYLDGDPDRPLVTGTVYNADNQPPYTSKTQSGIKTQSTKGGGASNYNELRFDDKKGSEEVYLRAEKDHNRLVKNDEVGNIENDQTTNIKNDQATNIKGKQTVDVKKTIFITANQSIELKVGGSTIKIEPSGITLKATKIEIDGTIAEVKGSGMVTVKGGITKIN